MSTKTTATTPATAQELLDHIRSLPSHDEHMRYCCQLGRNTNQNTESDIKRILNEILDGKTYPVQFKELCVFTAVFANSSVALLASRKLGNCFKQWIDAESLTAEMVLEHATNLTTAARRMFWKSARNSLPRNQEFTDILYDGVLKRWGAAEAVHITVAMNAAQLSRVLSSVGHLLGGKTLHDVARHLPGRLLTFIQSELEKTQDDSTVWTRFASVMPLLAKSYGGEILVLLAQSFPSGKLPSGYVNLVMTMAKKHPAQAFRLLTGADNQLSERQYSYHGRSWGYKPVFPIKLALKRFSVPQLQEFISIIRQRGLFDVIERYIHYAAPSKRQPLVNTALENLEIGLAHSCVLKYAEEQRRVEAVKKLLATAVIASSRQRQLEVYPMYPWKEGFAALKAESHSPDQSERTLAIRGVVVCAENNRQGVDQAVSFLCNALKNEKEPIRSPIVNYFGQHFPIALLKDSDLNELDLLVDTVISARDTNRSSISSLQQFVQRVLTQHVNNPKGIHFQWAVATFFKLVDSVGEINFPVFTSLSTETAKLVVDVILKAGDKLEATERAELTLKVAIALDRRGWQIDSLVQAIRKELFNYNRGYAIQAAQLYIRDPRTKRARIEELYKIDRSIIYLSNVLAYMVKKLQPLFEDVLLDPSINGHFGLEPDRFSRVLMAVTRLAAYLLPDVENNFKSFLLKDAKNEADVPLFDRARLVRELRHFPGLELSELLPFIGTAEERLQVEQARKQKLTGASTESSSSSDVAVSEVDNTRVIEAGLLAASRLQDPSSVVDVYLSFLSTEQARVAMYCLYRCFMRMPVPAVQQVVLENLNSTNMKITVKKEWMRLCGAFRIFAGVESLSELFFHEKTHRDVKIAIYHGLISFMDQEAAWRVLETGPKGDEYLVRSLVTVSRSRIAEEFRARYLGILLECMSRTEPEVLTDVFTSLVNWACNNDSAIMKLLVPHLLDPSIAPDVFPRARSLLIACVSANTEEDVLHLVREMARVDVKKQVQGQSGNDLKIYQNLRSILFGISSYDASRAFVFRPLCKRLGAALQPLPQFQYFYMLLDLASCSLTYGDTAELVTAAQKLGNAIESLLVTGMLGFHYLRDAVALVLNSVQSNLFKAHLILRLYRAEKQRLKLLALTLLPELDASSWTDEHVQMLLDARTSSDVDIQVTALHTFRP